MVKHHMLPNQERALHWPACYSRWRFRCCSQNCAHQIAPLQSIEIVHQIIHRYKTVRNYSSSLATFTPSTNVLQHADQITSGQQSETYSCSHLALRLHLRWPSVIGFHAFASFVSRLKCPAHHITCTFTRCLESFNRAVFCLHLLSANHIASSVSRLFQKFKLPNGSFIPAVDQVSHLSRHIYTCTRGPSRTKGAPNVQC